MAAYSVIHETLNRERQKNFEQTAERVQQWIEERMLNHVNTLRGLQALWAANPSGISHQTFENYLDSLNALNDYPSISSVIFVKRSGSQLLTTYIKPLAGRETALNFDANSDPFRREFFAKVRDSGQITSSDPIPLLTTAKPGFFLAAPLYRSGATQHSLTERREKLIGFAAMVFRDTELFKAIFGRQNPLPDIDFVIYHEYFEAPPGSNHLLFDSDPEFNPAVYPDLLQTKKYVTIGNTPWTIFISAKPSFSLNTAEEKLPLIILSSGLILSGILGLIILYFYRQHLKTWH